MVTPLHWTFRCGAFEWVDCHHLRYDEETSVGPLDYTLICSHHTTCYCCPLPAELVTLFRVSVCISSQTKRALTNRVFSVA